MRWPNNGWGENPRHVHTFHDEDAMMWLKRAFPASKYITTIIYFILYDIQSYYPGSPTYINILIHSDGMFVLILSQL